MGNVFYAQQMFERIHREESPQWQQEYEAVMAKARDKTVSALGLVTPSSATGSWLTGKGTPLEKPWYMPMGDYTLANHPEHLLKVCICCLVMDTRPV